MSATLTLPPTDRDFQIYQRVVLEGASTRQAAGEFSRSQTRMRQIVQRVTQWLAANLPPQDEATDAAYLRHAQHVAADRLSYFYGLAMDGWRTDGQMKYINLAIRLALAQSKLAVIPGTIECLAADAIEGPLPEEVQSPKSQVQSPVAPPTPNQQSPTLDIRPGTLDCPPPLRDCSPAPKKINPAEASATASPIANPTPPGASADIPSAKAAARRAFLTPAHHTPPTGDLPVTELKITPQELGFQTPTRSVSEGRPSTRAFQTPTRSVSEGRPSARAANEKRLSRRERRKLRQAKARA